MTGHTHTHTRHAKQFPEKIYELQSSTNNRETTLKKFDILVQQLASDSLRLSRKHFQVRGLAQCPDGYRYHVVSLKYCSSSYSSITL